jgi:hemerythrin superfamily protein
MKTSNQAMQPLHDVSEQDAIGMLIADHKRVASLFADFERLNDEGRVKDKAPVVREICQQLTVHTQLEEELFYPAVRKAIHDEDQMDEALVEHASAKQLIAQLMSADPGDDLYDAKVTVLKEQIDYHVEEEEGSMFPKARNSGLDALKLGTAMLARKRQLLGGAPARRLWPRLMDEVGIDADEGDVAKTRARVRPKKNPPQQKSTTAAKKTRRR